MSGPKKPAPRKKPVKKVAKNQPARKTKPKKPQVSPTAKTKSREVINVARISSRSVGRPRLFEDPKVLQQAIEDYYIWSDRNPWFKNDIIKSGERAGEVVQIPVTRPYTIERLCSFLGVGKNFFEQFEKSLAIDPPDELPERKKIREQLSGIITRMRQDKIAQNLEGAIVYAFNANIIARHLGMVDKKDISTGGESLNKGYYDLLRSRKYTTPETKDE